MTPKNVVITGAWGNIGRKLSAHCKALGWNVRLLDINTIGHTDIIPTNLFAYNDSWAQLFQGADAVIHLAANANAWAGSESIKMYNHQVTENVFRAAAEHKAGRVVFASSSWVMAGYLFESGPITTAMKPRPINPYGLSKLHGETLGKTYAARKKFSFIALRMGWCQDSAENLPGAHMGSRWEQEKWLSDRDMCQGLEQAASCEGVEAAVLNLMSDNPGMRWDIESTKEIIGYRPRDGAAAVVTPEVLAAEEHEIALYREAAALSGT